MTERLKVLTEQIMVRLTPEMQAALQAQAEHEGRTVAQVVRTAARDYLRRARA